MPLVYQQNINEHAQIGVWHITESETFFSEKAAAQYIINHPKKRVQHLAGRHLLKVMEHNFPVELIQINKHGRPFLENNLFYFSIAHSEAYVSVIISTKNSVGVDIESPNPKIEFIKDKFLSAYDINSLSKIAQSNVYQFTMGWCVKEALYKWAGLSGINFKLQLNIKSVLKENDLYTIDCVVEKDSVKKSVLVNGIVLNDNILTWVC